MLNAFEITYTIRIQWFVYFSLIENVGVRIVHAFVLNLWAKLQKKSFLDIWSAYPRTHINMS